MLGHCLTLFARGAFALVSQTPGTSSPEDDNREGLSWGMFGGMRKSLATYPHAAGVCPFLQYAFELKGGPYVGAPLELEGE